MICALHTGNNRTQLKAEFLRDLPPSHILTAHREDTLQIGGCRRSSGANAGRLRDRAAGQCRLQLLRRRLGNAQRTELLLRECQRDVNVAEAHLPGGRCDNGVGCGRDRQPAGSRARSRGGRRQRERRAASETRHNCLRISAEK